MKTLKEEIRHIEEKRLRREGEMRLHSKVSLVSLWDIWPSDFSLRAVGRRWTLYFIFSKTFIESLIIQLEKWAYHKYITPWIFTSWILLCDHHPDEETEHHHHPRSSLSSFLPVSLAPLCLPRTTLTWLLIA